MPRFSANISMLFREHDLLDRFVAAKNAGFGAVEIAFPYETPARDLKAAKEAAGLEMTVINVPAGDLVQGGPGLAAMPGREDDFRRAVDQALAYAEALRPRTMNVLAGSPPLDTFPRERCLEVLAANVAAAAAALEPLGVLAVVEAINPGDRPGFLINHTAEAIAVIDAAGHPNLAIEYDVYHMQITEGDLIRTLEANLPRIGNVQFADVPGRHEPGTGEINFPNLFAALDRMGWTGFLAAEYLPTGRTEESLAWMRPYPAG